MPKHEKRKLDKTQVRCKVCHNLLDECACDDKDARIEVLDGTMALIQNRGRGGSYERRIASALAHAKVDEVEE